MAPFIDGAIGECPKCGNHRFTAPAERKADALITCLSCGHILPRNEAVAVGLKKPGGKKFVPKSKPKPKR